MKLSPNYPQPYPQANFIGKLTNFDVLKKEWADLNAKTTDHRLNKCTLFPAIFLEYGLLMLLKRWLGCTSKGAV